MKEWMSAQEIADEKLPQMPKTQRGVKLLAEREHWDAHPFARKRPGSIGGGGMEYKFLLLPVAAQIALMQRYRQIGGDTPPAASTEPTLSANLSEKARLERDARIAILEVYNDFLKGIRAKRRAPNTALNLFSVKYNNRSLQVSAWVRDVIPSISPRSIMRWRAAVKKDADALAIDRSKARKGSGVLETANGGAVKAFIIAWIAKSSHLAAQTIRDYCELEFGAELTLPSGEIVPLPPLRTFQHTIKQLKADNKVVLTKITNPDQYRSTMRIAGTGTYRHVTEPNGLWMIDASPMDALCIDGRWSIYVCVDIATRRTVITLSRTPRAAAVALMIRKTTLKYGVASIIKTDNGSDFKAYSIVQLFDALGIEADPSDA